MVIRLYITYSQHYHCFDIHNLHSGYTVSHRVNLHSFYLRVSAVFIRVLSKFIRAYITKHQNVLIMAYTHASFPSPLHFLSALHSCYMIILRIAEPQ